MASLSEALGGCIFDCSKVSCMGGRIKILNKIKWRLKMCLTSLTSLSAFAFIQKKNLSPHKTSAGGGWQTAVSGKISFIRIDNAKGTLKRSTEIPRIICEFDLILKPDYGCDDISTWIPKTGFLIRFGADLPPLGKYWSSNQKAFLSTSTNIHRILVLSVSAQKVNRNRNAKPR